MVEMAVEWVRLLCSMAISGGKFGFLTLDTCRRSNELSAENILGLLSSFYDLCSSSTSGFSETDFESKENYIWCLALLLFFSEGGVCSFSCFAVDVILAV
jgi:hypothetical protein